jgi:hypothetical protein
MGGGIADGAYSYDKPLGFTLIGGADGHFSALP